MHPAVFLVKCKSGAPAQNKALRVPEVLTLTLKSMTDNLRILILEDLAEDAELLQRELRRSKINFTARHVASKADYLKGLDESAQPAHVRPV